MKIFQSIPYPEYTTVERNALVGTLKGYRIFNTTKGIFEKWNGTAWEPEEASNMPKTVFISKSGNDTTGKVENGYFPFLTLQAAWDALPVDAYGWDIKFILENTGEVFETEVGFRNDRNISFVNIHIPKGMTLTNSKSDNSSVLHYDNAGVVLCRVNIYGEGSITRTGTPSSPTSTWCIKGSSMTNILGFDTIRNYTGGGAIRDVSRIENGNLIKSSYWSILDAYRGDHIKNVKLIEGVTALRLCDHMIENCVVKSDGGPVNNPGYAGLKAKNSTFITENFPVTSYAISTIDIENVRVYNEYDTNNVSGISYGGFGISTTIRIKDSVVAIKNPDSGTGKYSIKGGGTLSDAEISGLIVNKELDRQITTTSSPQVIRRTLVSRQATDINYSIWASHHAYISHDDTQTYCDKITITALTTDTDEQVIDKLISAWDAIKATSTWFNGYTVSKGFDGTNWYLESTSEHILKRLNERIGTSGSGASMDTNDFVVTIPTSVYGLYNHLDPDNLHGNIRVNKSIGTTTIDDEARGTLYTTPLY